MRVAIALTIALACAAVAPAGAAVLQGNRAPYGTVATAQTGTLTNSTDQVLCDYADEADFEIDVTGACSVTIVSIIQGGTLPLAGNPGSPVCTAATADSLCRIYTPLGKYGVATTACAGSVTVKYQCKNTP